MNNKQENKRSPIGHAGIALFGNIRVMAVAALLTALSIVLGKYLAVNVTDSLRISFENLPILMAGLFFGPLIGGVVGAAADMIGCFLVGYSINPIITLGAFLIGVISGIIGMYAFPGKENWRATPRVFLPVALSHIICSMGIKSLGMIVYFDTPWEILIMRVPIYIFTAAVEGYLIMLLFRNRNFSGLLSRIINKS
ncbi:MAG: folate family ECF transporter S component [Clostridia bacterium]|nr:folate family ECF transporter S component [Clostridia bacterium]